jgi:hypothetical protein
MSAIKDQADGIRQKQNRAIALAEWRELMA